MVFEILIAIFFALSCITNSIYYIWVGILLMFPAIHHRYDNVAEKELYFYILIPCLNEEKVIANTMTNLLKLNYKNLIIVPINDASSDGTKSIIDDLADRNDNVMPVHREFPNAQEGKGAALNYAYTKILEDVNKRELNPHDVIIGVLDADTFIKKSLIMRVNEMFCAEHMAGMVQTRVRIGISTRDYVLPLMQDLEFYSYINRMQNAREYMGTVAAAGNGQFNRLSAVMSLGDKPWGSCLLEDFDFSLRLLLNGFRTRLLQDESVYQQGVLNYKKFVNQRIRWIQGSIQCTSYIKDVIKNESFSIWGKLEIIYFIILPYISFTSTAVFLFSWFLILYAYITNTSQVFALLQNASLPALITLLVVLMSVIYMPGVVFAIHYYNETKEHFWRCLLSGMFMPIYNMLQTPAILGAFVRQIRGKNNWKKTERV